MKPRILLLPAIIAALLLVAIPRAPADEFYNGKTLTFVVGFSAGGGFDTYTRLIARHFGKHVPGNPTVVVENRTGAGSLIAANYIYNQAPRDGTVVGNWIGPLVLQQVLGNNAAKFDGRKFGWLGVPTADSGVCALTKASGINTMDDWFNSKRSGEVHIVLQTIEKSHPELKNVPLAIQYAKSDEARALLGIANGPYSQGARPYSVPPGVPQDRLQLLQKAFIETLRDPDLLMEAKKAQIDIDPIDGPTVTKMMAGLYELSPAFKSKLTKLLIPGAEKKM